MAAGERHPDYALGVDIAAARTETRHRDIVHFRQLGLRIEADDAAFAGEHIPGVPDRTVDRIRHHRVSAGAGNAHVLVRIHRLARLGVVVELAVAVGVEHERRPALRLLGAAGLVEHLGVEPAGDRPAAAGPQGVVLVEAELQMMRAEAGIDEGELLRLRIVHRQLPFVAVERERLGVGIVRALAAEGRRAGRVIGPGHPDIALAVEHVVVIVELGVPDLLHAPIGRRRQRLFDRRVARTEGFRHVRAFRRRDEGDLLGLRIEHRQVVGGVFGRAVERAVGVDGRIALVGRDQVVQIFFGAAPIPFRDHDIALDALRPRRLGGRQLAIGDAVGPLAEIFERHAAELAGKHVHHERRGLAATARAAPRPLRHS